MPNEKVALVTGASSGFGQLTAGLLAAGGFRVFGTSRRPQPDGDGVEMLELDVTSPSSVETCVRTVLTRSGTIDVLVNNAGQTHASLIEETPIDVAMRIFDSNFWGVVRVTNVVLPAMRKQRSGLILNVSSLCATGNIGGWVGWRAGAGILCREQTCVGGLHGKPPGGGSPVQRRCVLDRAGILQDKSAPVNVEFR